MKIFIGNLPLDGRIKQEDLRPLFEQFGTVDECVVKTSYGFVHMHDEVSGSKAISKLNGYTIMNRRLLVEKSIKNYPRNPPWKRFVSNWGDGSASQQTGEDLKTERFLKTNKRLPICNSKYTIPEPNWAQWMNSDSLFEVIVAEVFSPDKFFIQFKDNLTSRSLDDLMDRMEDFYDANGDDYKLKDSLLEVGLNCVVKFSDQIWYRARITSLNNANVEVFFVDYGTIAIIQQERLCILLEEFSKLPCQALKSKLFGVKSAMEEWPTESSLRFLELVSGPSERGGLLAYVKGVGNELSLWLVDTITTNLACGMQINLVMVDQGFALLDDDFNNNNLIQETDNKNIGTKSIVNNSVLSARPHLTTSTHESREFKTKSETSNNSLISKSSANSSFGDEKIPLSRYDQATLEEYEMLMKFKIANYYYYRHNQPKYKYQNKIFVGNLSSKTTKNMFTSYFSQFGQLVFVDLLEGFGFVTYAHEKHVDACQKMRPHMLDGRQVDTKRAMPKQEIRNITKGGIKKICVGELNDNVEDGHLLKYFGKFGSPVSVNRVTDNETGEKIDFAFVEFDDYDVVDKIILKGNHEINGVKVDITKALSKSDAYKMSKSRKN